MARPEFGAIALGIVLNFDNFTARGGNPELEPYESTQVDWSLEWYFDEGSLAQVSLYFKELENFLFPAF